MVTRSVATAAGATAVDGEVPVVIVASEVDMAVVAAGTLGC